MFRDIETWHPKEFDLSKGEPLQPALSEYALDPPRNSVRDYVIKRRKISDFLEPEEFLWCLDPPRDDVKEPFSSHKRIRWRLKVKTDRIIAYVEVQRWEDEIHERKARPANEIVFRSPIGQASEYSILVKWPLLPEEIVGRDEFVYDSERLTWNSPIREDFS